MTTPRALIVRALKKSGVHGVGQSPNTTDLADALDDLNDMTAQWARRRFLIPHLIECVFGPVGQEFYTVSSSVSSDIVTPRPDRIEAAFVRLNQFSVNAVDYVIDVLDSREDYNRIVLKGYAAVPLCLYYEPAYPQGKLYLWPRQAATGAANVHIFVKGSDLSVTWSLDDTIALPPEYNEALLYNLAARLRFSYQLPVDVTLAAMAATSLATLRAANSQLPRLVMPTGLPGMYRGSTGLAGLFAGSSSTSPEIFQLDISPLDGTAVLL